MQQKLHVEQWAKRTIIVLQLVSTRIAVQYQIVIKLVENYADWRVLRVEIDQNKLDKMYPAFIYS